jgi:hypothetical protein
MVVTALPASGASQPPELRPADISVLLDKTIAPVISSQRLTGDLAGMQLYILLDDSTRSSSLSLQIPELKNFIRSLPPSTEVAIGYMRNGSAVPAQAFTTDHQKAADALRLPMGIPGGNGSPYFTLSDLTKHWPSKGATGRRAVLMLTDGVDRYYGNSMVDDPYVEAATNDAVKKGVIVYSIYLRGSGFYGRGDRQTLFAQSRLTQVSDTTGGHAYFQNFSDPVSVAPFLEDLAGRFDNQYQVTVEAFNDKGVRTVKVRSVTPAVKLEGPARVYVP